MLDDVVQLFLDSFFGFFGHRGVYADEMVFGAGHHENAVGQGYFGGEVVLLGLLRQGDKDVHLALRTCGDIHGAHLHLAARNHLALVGVPEVETDAAVLLGIALHADFECARGEDEGGVDG